MGFLLVLFWCSSALFNSRFGAFISRFAQKNSRFGQLRELARKGLIWLTVFGSKRMANREIDEIPGSTGKTGDACYPSGGRRSGWVVSKAWAARSTRSSA